MNNNKLKDEIGKVLEEAFIEFGATSPTRNWDLELSPNKEQIQKEVQEHIKIFIKEALTRILELVEREYLIT